MGGLLDEAPPRTSERHRWFTAQVTTSDASGVYVTELGQPESTASKVTHGASYRDTASCADAAHTHALRPYPRGAVVLATETDHGVWIVRADLETLT